MLGMNEGSNFERLSSLLAKQNVPLRWLNYVVVDICPFIFFYFFLSHVLIAAAKFLFSKYCFLVRYPLYAVLRAGT